MELLRSGFAKFKPYKRENTMGTSHLHRWSDISHRNIINVHVSILLFVSLVCLFVPYLLLNHWADLKNIWHAYSPQPWDGLEKIKFGIGGKKFFSIFSKFFSVEIFHIKCRLRTQNFMIIGQAVLEISVRTDRLKPQFYI